MILLDALQKETADEPALWRINFYPLVVQGSRGLMFVKDHSSEDLCYVPFTDWHDNKYRQHWCSINDGVAVLETATMYLIDAEGAKLVRIALGMLEPAQCYSAKVPPACCDTSVLAHAPECRCNGSPRCTAAQVYMMVDGKLGQQPEPEWRCAANVWQCTNGNCGFRVEMQPDIYWFTSMRNAAEHNGCTTNYVMTEEQVYSNAEALNYVGDSDPVGLLAETRNSGRASESRSYTGNSRFGGKCISHAFEEPEGWPDSDRQDILQLERIKARMDDLRHGVNYHTKQHAFTYTTLQVLLWHYLGLDYRCVIADELKK